MDKTIMQAVLENSIKFNGKANKGAVIGTLISRDPSIKSRLKEISKMVDEIIVQIRDISIEEQKKRLIELNPDHFSQENDKKLQRKSQRKELPELRDAKDGQVITRMPPGPSKYPHIGHAVSFGINFLYSQKYNGQCILRYDDTNPDVDRQEFVDAIQSDVVDFLGLIPARTEFASDHIDEMYDFAARLISENKAYTCECQDISTNRRELKNCDHRSRSIEENLEIWDKMKEGHKSVLRLKIDMAHKNAVMRDPVVFRVLESKHFRQKGKFKAWPTYDFESSVMDGKLGVTHVLRSNEFDSRIELHDYIVKILGLPKTSFKHYGRTNITGSVTQGREIKKMIDSGEYIGWDDPRLMTLRALKRRGIVRESFIELAKTVGLSKTASNLDFTVISAINRKILDESASRFFLIDDPVLIKIEGAPDLELELSLHPHLRKGGRFFKTTDEFNVSKKDLDKISDGELIRLMDCLNFRKQGNRFIFDSTELEKYKSVGKMIIHWLPKETVDVEVMTPDCRIIKGIAEKNIELIEIGSVVQFERYAFCRLDSKNRFWFTHK